jgi:hypothetical protein
MLKSNLLHIGAQKAALSKRQKEFNRLTKKIEQTDKLILELRKAGEQLQQRADKEMKPILAEMTSVRAEIVRAMDRVYPDKLLKKTDHLKLARLITDLSFELINDEGLVDLKPIFNKYSDRDFDTVHDEGEREAAETARQMASMFGVEFDDEDDISTPDQFQEQMFKKLFEQQEAVEEEERIKAEKRAKRPKSQKQQEREEREKEHEQNLTKSVRSVYMDLVKAFHPDREKDEVERQRKTEIMQRVTQAYNDNNLLNLLKLQMEFDRIDQEHLETLADDQLLYYNKVLKQQLDDLEMMKSEIVHQLARLADMSPYHINSVEFVFFKFNQDLSDFKKELKTTKSEIALWSDARQVKAFLKTYKIPKPDDFGFF